MATRAAPPPSAAGARTRIRTEEDRQASELLLAFTRLLRAHRPEQRLPRHVDELLKSGFLAPRHLGAFAVIALEGPLSVSQLARSEGCALSTASMLVTQLAEAGLVERREDADDRRRTVVSVAPRYRQESEAVLAGKLAPLRRALARMGPRRARALMEALEILGQEVGGTEPGASGSSGGGSSRRPGQRPADEEDGTT